ncbi:MAG: ECF transporter S component [Clostridiales bacterium]|nr:ECF transporter S component [Clostridiales bacterium]
MTAVKKSIVTAVCIALCVVLPQAFHAIPNAGSIYCPMHIPVLLCGLLCGWQYGAVCGIAGPLISSLFTGMPPAAMLPQMMIECFVYGLIAGLIMKLIKTKNIYADLYTSLILAMLSGRIIAGIAKALIFAKGELTIAAWATSYFVTALPGIIIQLVLIPTIVFALMKANLVPQKYPKIEE